MFDDVSESDFPAFLSALWAEKGWETSVQANEDGTYLVAGDKSDGTRGLIGVRPGADTEIGASEVEDFAAFCDRKGVDVRVMATRGRFTTGARSAADAGDVALLDPNELASTVREEGAEDLVAEYADGGSPFDDLPGLPFAVPAGVPSGIPVGPIAIAAVVVFAAVFVGGPVASLVPVVGGGGASADAGPAVTALSLAADGDGTAGSQGAADGPRVAWDATVTDDVAGFSAPDGKTFVVVRANVTATGGPATLRAEDFALHANGTYYAVQEFENASDGFRRLLLPIRVSPDSPSRAVLVFTVPEGVEGATLVERYGGPGVRFVRASLAFDVAAA